MARRRTSRNDSETVRVQFVVSATSHESSLGDVAAGKSVNGTSREQSYLFYFFVGGLVDVCARALPRRDRRRLGNVKTSHEFE